MARFTFMPVQAAAQGISFIGRQSRDWRVTVARTSLDRLVYQMVFPYLSIYIVALGATATQLGAINSAGMVAAAILGPSTGWLIDRIGAKRVYLAGIGMLAVSYLTYSLAQNWPMALVAMVGYWLGYSTSILGCATVCGNCLASRDRATGMMICETVAAGVLGMAGPLIGAWLVASSGGVEVSGIRPLFVVATVATLGTFALVLTQLSDRRWVNVRATPKRMFRDLHQVLKDGQHLKRWLVVTSIGQLPTGHGFPILAGLCPCGERRRCLRIGSDGHGLRRDLHPLRHPSGPTCRSSRAGRWCCIWQCRSSGSPTSSWCGLPIRHS